MAINRCCRNVIVDTILNIIPLDKCPPIIQEVNDISLAVDGTAVGQLTVERYIDSGDVQHIHLYYWDGADWILLIDSSSRFEDGGFTTYEFNNFIDSNWFYSLDDGATWSQDTQTTFDPPVSSITILFRNTLNGCVYTNLPIIPLVNPCYASLGTYTDIVLAPSGSVVGDIALVSFLDGGSSFEYREIYEWDGANWVQMAQIIVVPPGPYDGANVVIAYIDPSWLLSFTEGAVWSQNTSQITTPLAVLPVWFKNANDCIYNLTVN